MFAFLAICPGAVQITINAAGGFLSNRADFDTLTLGNFGLQSSNANAASLNVTLPSTNGGQQHWLCVALQIMSFALTGPHPGCIQSHELKHTVGQAGRCVNRPACAAVVVLHILFAGFFCCARLFLLPNMLSSYVR